MLWLIDFIAYLETMVWVKRHHLHADNCARENKNNPMVQYLMCRILTGQQSTVHYSFLIVGHTKFSPDWSLGIFSVYSKHKGGYIAEEVVKQSSVCYVAQEICHED